MTNDLIVIGVQSKKCFNHMHFTDVDSFPFSALLVVQPLLLCQQDVCHMKWRNNSTFVFHHQKKYQSQKEVMRNHILWFFFCNTLSNLILLLITNAVDCDVLLQNLCNCLRLVYSIFSSENAIPALCITLFPTDICLKHIFFSF